MIMTIIEMMIRAQTSNILIDYCNENNLHIGNSPKDEIYQLSSIAFGLVLINLYYFVLCYISKLV